MLERWCFTSDSPVWGASNTSSSPPVKLRSGWLRVLVNPECGRCRELKKLTSRDLGEGGNDESVLKKLDVDPKGPVLQGFRLSSLMNLSPCW